MNATGECTDNTSPYAHTLTFFRCVRLRTPDVLTRMAQELDDLFVCLKSHSFIGHVVVECSFDSVSFYFLITYCLTDTTYCLSYTTDRNQIKPLCNSAQMWTVWPIWPIRSQTQVMSPRSASMSVASTRRSTFGPDTWASSKSTTPQSPPARTLINLDILVHQAAASIRHWAEFPLCWN